jgi:hypothetical protein
MSNQREEEIYGKTDLNTPCGTVLNQYDLENKIIAAIKPRPAFLSVLRMLNGIMEFDETRGLLVTEHWCDRNRRASDYLQEGQRDRQTIRASACFQ